MPLDRRYPDAAAGAPDPRWVDRGNPQDPTLNASKTTA